MMARYFWTIAFRRLTLSHVLRHEHRRNLYFRGSRTAFEMKQESDGRASKYVYKIMKYGKQVDEYHIEQQRKDALVMERTSGSKFIPNIHGYCSLVSRPAFLSIDDVDPRVLHAVTLTSKLDSVAVQRMLSGGDDGFYARGEHARLHQR